MRALVVISVCFFREGIERALIDDGIATTRFTLDSGNRPDTSDCDVAVVDLVAQSLSSTIEALPTGVPVVGLALTSDPPVAAAAALGVRAFVGCDQTLSALVLAVRRAARGDAVCPESIASVLINSLGGTPAGPFIVRTACLTRREREIGQLVVRGMSNREIADALVIEPATVKNHVHQILRKLDVRRRGQAADLLRGLWTDGSMLTGRTVQTETAIR